MLPQKNENQDSNHKELLFFFFKRNFFKVQSWGTNKKTLKSEGKNIFASSFFKFWQ